VFREDRGEPPSIMVVLRPPGQHPSVPQRLTAVSYLRPVAQIKHVGTFGQIYHGEAAERAGYDDALLTGPGNVISERDLTAGSRTPQAVATGVRPGLAAASGARRLCRRSG
jgi:hypothetical protein